MSLNMGALMSCMSHLINEVAGDLTQTLFGGGVPLKVHPPFWIWVLGNVSAAVCGHAMACRWGGAADEELGGSCTPELTQQLLLPLC